MEKQTREIDEEKLMAVVMATAALVEAAAYKVGAQRDEIVYGVLSGLVGCTDDGSEIFANFLMGAMSEAINAADVGANIHKCKGLH